MRSRDLAANQTHASPRTGPVPELNLLPIDRSWFLTWTTYGTWLPGDKRGFIGEAKDNDGVRRPHNQHGTPVAMPSGRLARYARDQMDGPPVVLDVRHANGLLEQFLETTRHRRWLLVACGIMPTHLHAVVGVPSNPDPEKLLNDLKAYATRRLNTEWQPPPSHAWWTRSGSKRKLPDAHAVEAAVEYIHRQPNPLLIWSRERGLVFRRMGEVDGV